MPDKEGNAVRGEVAHWSYRKDKAKGLKFDKDGNMISQGPPELDLEAGKSGVKGTDLPKAKGPKGTPDPRGIYTKAVAKGFNRGEQLNLLKARSIRTTRRDTEPSLVAKILDSNPKPDVPDEPNAPEPDAPPVPPKDESTQEGTAPRKYTEDELKDFKVKKLVEILKGLGCKRQPMTEKGKIKKIV